MVFSPSVAGVIHAPEEDTAEPDLRAAIEAFAKLASRRLS
jgi:acetylornithine deacetylase/succinyl-diaminopimelate desuccinylase-like protein